jgi:3-oxoacyl-(acyl-carrier-protein) synthase
MYINSLGLVGPISTADLGRFWKLEHSVFQNITQYLPHCDVAETNLQFGGVAKPLDGRDLPNRKLSKLVERKDLLCLHAVAAAIADFPDLSRVIPERRGVFVGACATQLGDLMPYFEAVPECVDRKAATFCTDTFGELVLERVNPIAAVRVLMNGALAHVAQVFDCRGANVSFVDGRMSGLFALESALTSLARDEIDVAIVAAMTAPFDPFQIADGFLFEGLGPQGDDINQQCRPYDFSSAGRVLSEGAVAFVIQREPNAQTFGRLLQAKSGNLLRANSFLQPLFQHTEPAFIAGASKGSASEDKTEIELLSKLAPMGQTPIFSASGVLGDWQESGILLRIALSLAALKQGIMPPTPNCGQAMTSRISLCPGPVSAKSAIALELDLATQSCGAVSFEAS